jgi:hypothetical protein
MPVQQQRGPLPPPPPPPPPPQAVPPMQDPLQNPQAPGLIQQPPEQPNLTHEDDSAQGNVESAQAPEIVDLGKDVEGDNIVMDAEVAPSRGDE